MALKFKYKSKYEVPAELASLYAEREGTWQLDVDGVADPDSVEEFRRTSKAKLDGFRNTDLALMRERDELKRRFERSESEQVRAMVTERDALNARVATVQIDEAVVNGATKRGLRASAKVSDESQTPITSDLSLGESVGFRWLRCLLGAR